MTLPVHMVLIRDLGVTLGEILDFDELADDCAGDGVSTSSSSPARR